MSKPEIAKHRPGERGGLAAAGSRGGRNPNHLSLSSLSDSLHTVTGWDPHTGGGHGGRGASAEIRKIFVGGLSHQTNEASLTSYFSRFGPISDVVVMTEGTTRRPRGFGFVTFEEANAVEVVCRNQYHPIDSRLVEVKPAIPREQMRAGPMPFGGGPAAANNLEQPYAGGGGGGGGGAGMPHGGIDGSVGGMQAAEGLGLYAAGADGVPGGEADWYHPYHPYNMMVPTGVPVYNGYAPQAYGMGGMPGPMPMGVMPQGPQMLNPQMAPAMAARANAGRPPMMAAAAAGMGGGMSLSNLPATALAPSQMAVPPGAAPVDPHGAGIVPPGFIPPAIANPNMVGMIVAPPPGVAGAGGVPYHAAMPLSPPAQQWIPNQPWGAQAWAANQQAPGMGGMAMDPTMMGGASGGVAPGMMPSGCGMMHPAAMGAGTTAGAVPPAAIAAASNEAGASAGASATDTDPEQAASAADAGETAAAPAPAAEQEAAAAAPAAA